MTTGAIYAPPKKGLPFLVVTVNEGEKPSVTPVASREEARDILAAQTIDKRERGASFANAREQRG